MITFIITDGIMAKQYVSDDRETAEEQFEKCVMDAMSKGHELTKDDRGYHNKNGDYITRNWGGSWSEQVPSSELEDFSGAYSCQLCGDTIHEDFGFCVKCKKVI